MPGYDWLRADTSPLNCLNDWLAHRMAEFRLSKRAVARLVGAQMPDVSNWTRYWPVDSYPDKLVPGYAARRVAERYVPEELILVDRICRLRNSAEDLGNAVKILVKVEDRKLKEGVSTNSPVREPLGSAAHLFDWLAAAARDAAFQETTRMGRGDGYAIERWSDYLIGAAAACRMVTAVRRKNDPGRFLREYNVDLHCRSETKMFTRLFLMINSNIGKYPSIIQNISQELWLDIAGSARYLLGTRLDNYLLAWSTIEVFYLSNEKSHAHLTGFEKEAAKKIKQDAHRDNVLAPGMEFSSRNLNDRGIVPVKSDLINNIHLKFDLYYYGKLPAKDLENPSLHDSHRPYAQRAAPYLVLDMIKHGAESSHKRDLEYCALRVVADRFGPHVFSDCSQELFEAIEQDATAFTSAQRNWARELAQGLFKS